MTSSFDLKNTTVADLLVLADPNKKETNYKKKHEEGLLPTTTTTNDPKDKGLDLDAEEAKARDAGQVDGGPILIENWAQSYSVDLSKFRRPKTLQELKDIVSKETNIRVVGSMHSCAPLIDSPGCIVSLEYFDQILHVDTDKKMVRLQGGAKIHDLCEALKPYGLAVGTLGTIDWQTLSGAVMTGTHGGSLTTPSLHSFVTSYTILKADGDMVKVTKSEDPHLFSAMAPSMGVFGIVVEMEMVCTPFQHLAASMISIPFKDLLGPTNFMDIMKKNKYCRIIVYPSLQQATIWGAEPVNSIDEAIANGAYYNGDYINFRSPEEKKCLEEWMEHYADGDHTKCDDKLQQVLDSQLKRLNYYVGDYNHVLCKERNNGIPHADMEFGFEFEKAPQVLQAMFEYCQSNRLPYYNFEMRTTKADDAMLSCCYKRDTLWIDFQCKAEDMSDFFGDMEDLLAPIGYRKHWAKGFDHTSPEYLMKQFPMLGDFLTYIEQFDPQGKFRNEHVDMWVHEQTKSCFSDISATAAAASSTAAVMDEKPTSTSMDDTLTTHDMDSSSMDETWKAGVTRTTTMVVDIGAVVTNKMERRSSTGSMMISSSGKMERRSSTGSFCKAITTLLPRRDSLGL